MLGEACDDHARGDSGSADTARLEKEVLELLEGENAGTVFVREEVARRLSAMVLLGFDTDRADSIVRHLALMQREKKPASDAWGKTGDKVRRLLESGE